jgi:hypothetical protein
MPTAPTAGTTRPSAAQLIRGAHAELAAHGWHQGDFADDTGRLCLLGALRRSAGAHPLEEPADPRLLATLHDAERALAQTLRPARSAAGTDPVGVLIRWNDTPARTAGEILAHLAAVADALDPPAASHPDPGRAA